MRGVGRPLLAALPDAAWEMVPAERRLAASVDWHPEHGDRCQYLTFTSPGLDRDGLSALLDSCLLTDDEYAAGRDRWQQLPHAFDDLLDPVAGAAGPARCSYGGPNRPWRTRT